MAIVVPTSHSPRFRQSASASFMGNSPKPPHRYYQLMVVTAIQEIESAHAAAQRVVQTHERLVEFLRAGLTLAQVDAFIAETLKDLQCRSAFLNYSMQGHP